MSDREIHSNSENGEADARIHAVLMRHGHAWRLVRLGLRLTYYGTIAVYFSAAAGLACTWAGTLMPLRGEEGLFHAMQVFTMGLFAASLLVSTVGRYLCCNAPAESGARGYAVWSVACLTALVVIAGVWFTLSQFGWDRLPFLEARNLVNPRLFFVLNLALLIGLYIGNHVLFVHCLLSVEKYVGEARHEQSPRGRLLNAIGEVVLLGFVVGGVFTGFCGLTLVLFPIGRYAVGVFGILLLLLRFIHFLLLLGNAHDRIAEALRRAGS